MRILTQVTIINSLPLHTHTQETLARQTHLPLLNPSPPILYFPLRLCTEVCSIHSGLRNPWCSFFIVVSHQRPTSSYNQKLTHRN
ncbi:unnamed protein product [Hymenolepis diminuta]|uniref:Uncharacterized protein n=1 Tax=Hymenolepis diminuta TaxID=6216 RepID=A0A564Y6Y0_HYMDI|nr:unnamed protein product [Hymenolepis diminuta]